MSPRTGDRASIDDFFRDFSEVLDRGTPARVAELLERVSRLSDDDLLNEQEHKVATLWWLATIVARIHGLEPAPVGAQLTDRFQEISRYFSGRIVSRSKDVVALIYRAHAERNVDLLVDVGDHISQGWLGYTDSAFPRALAALAATFGPQTPERDFTFTSYVHWRRGLAAASAGDFHGAAAHFDRSCADYERLGYVSDVAWLYVDRLLCALATADLEEATHLREAQHDYVEKVILSAPLGDSDALSNFDVVSDDYTTFVEARTVGDLPLSAYDRTLLRRYVEISEHLLRPGVEDFVAAMDLFSFGWQTYQQSAYPVIFGRVAEARGLRLNEGNTCYGRWLDLLDLPRTHPSEDYFLGQADELERRLSRIGLTDEASVAVLDAALASYLMFGRATALRWLEPRRHRPQAEAARLYDAALAALRTPVGHSLDGALSTYVAARSAHTRPSFTGAIISLAESRRGITSRNLSVRLTPRELSVSGVTIYSSIPPVIGALLDVLIEDFARARAAGGFPQPRSAAELAAELGISLGAVTQAFHRLRSALRDVFATTLSAPLDDVAVVQGRPGYRLNPVYVESAVSTLGRDRDHQSST